MSEITELREKSQNLKVLFVEDNVELSQTTLDFLRKLFKNVEFAPNGMEALKIINQNKFDILITDLHMPRMSGFELIREVKKKDKDIYICAMTGMSGELDDTLDGIDILLEKPVSFDIVITMIKKAISQKEKRG